MHWSSLMLMKNIIFKLFILRILLGEHQISLSEMDFFLYIQLQSRELILPLSLFSLTPRRSFKPLGFHISFLNGFPNLNLEKKGGTVGMIKKETLLRDSNTYSTVIIVCGDRFGS